MGFMLPASAGASSADVFFGISSFGQLGSDDEAAEIQRLGIKRVRNNVVWRNFQQSNCNDQIETGVNFGFYDSVIRRAAEHDITIIADLYGSRLPTNCPNGADLHEFPVPSTQLYKDFVLEGGFVWQVVQRYGVNGSFWAEPKNQDLVPHPIKIWEVWNEPNLGENNPNNIVWPQGYANLLIDTAQTIRKAQEELIGQNPWNVGTRVLFGGLYGDTEWATGGEVYWHMDRYLDTAYDNPEGYTASQLHSGFDGFSYHPYKLHGNVQDVINITGGARAVLDQHGDSNKELWLTEIGWPVAFGAHVGLPSYSPQQVGDMLNDVLTWIHANETYLKAEYAATFVYQDLPNACGAATCWPAYAGIRDVSGTERPAWCRISNLVYSNGNSCEFGSPYLATEPAGNVQGTQATMRGWINPRGLKTHYTFQWGKTTSYTNENPISPDGYAGWQPSHQEVSETIYGLAPSTTYHYRLVATNAAGTTYGADRAFTTPGPPSATTEPAGAGKTIATLNGKINPYGLATTYQFEYGETTAYGSQIPVTPKEAGSGIVEVSVSEGIEGLKSLTTYHYRLVATNAKGTAYGVDRTFTTQALGGKFAPSTSWGPWGTAYSMALGDVNGDGRADIVGRSSTDVHVGLSTGSKFNYSTVWIGWGTAYSLDLADVNGDGRADIVGRNSTTGDVQVGLSTGSSFSPSTSWSWIWGIPYSMLFADVNGDGRSDLIGRSSAADVQVGLSSGSGFASSSNWNPWSTAYSMQLADVNSDKRADIVGRNSSGDVQVGLATN